MKVFPTPTSAYSMSIRSSYPAGTVSNACNVWPLRGAIIACFTAGTPAVIVPVPSQIVPAFSLSVPPAVTTFILGIRSHSVAVSTPVCPLSVTVSVASMYPAMSPSRRTVRAPDPAAASFALVEDSFITSAELG